MNRRLILSGLVLALLATPVSGALAQEASPGGLARRLDAVLERYAPAQSHVGVSVITLADGAVLYERQADKLFLPASVQKVLTTTAALSLLGSQKRFATRLMAEGLVEGGRLRGHLFLKGEGDPTLEAEDLEALAGKLAASGIREVAGDLVTDATAFGATGLRPDGWAWDDLAWGYGAPVSALSLHRNAVDVAVAPGAAGGAVRVALTPPTAYVQLRTQAVTHPAGGVSTLAIRGDYEGGVERWTLTGGLGAGSAQETLSRSVSDPARFTGTVLKEALARRGVVVMGRVRPGAAPAQARNLAVHQSPPLADLVRLTNKDSDNLIAETLLLHAGIRAKGGPGTWEKGLAAVSSFLERAGWPQGAYRLSDGSGLSRYNAVTPGQMSRLLRHVAGDRLAYPAFLISLPVSGVDGTLGSRLSAGPAKGRLRAKTGTMSGVSGLAGYLDSPRGPIVVSIFVNGFAGSAAPSRELQDKLVEALAAPAADGPTP